MKILKGVIAIMTKDGKLLVTKRKMEPFKGMYWFLGGFIEENENHEDALIREVKEESGFDVEIRDYIGTSKTKYKNSFYQISIFKSEIVGGSKKIQKKEIEEIKWMDTDDFIENLRKNNDFPKDKINFLTKIIS